ncbi:TetR/AcrR family transcriptional regulator [Nisaea sp.]|uniref:TetR/AcrR family transcriptional regulator n=1 Tax=Nisaea sp. TaxID=2024842 RepID=UPI002B27AB79|nr:TetR/AcrR family transcriptional regulator [Nisaea sp.]
MVKIDQNFPDSEPLTEKQRQIVDAACKLFTEQGYEVTSMDKVAAEANVSKRTVYSYFDSKEHLFCTVMGGMCAGFGEPNSDDIDYSGTLREVLTDCALLILAKVNNPEKLRLMRTVIAEAEQFPLIGETFWNEGPGKMRNELAGYIGKMQDEGLLRKTDPAMAAAHFQGFVTGPFMIQRLFTSSCDWTAEDAINSVGPAVESFLKAYAPD